ncbi:hypothetical protein [Actinoplanes sp. RD1]|uniref:hypothetical protein n=1 Tax=Actinoplanes sp. RD1 TaxID=3064538 RepID=UPI0027418738|nr:hypothetical protein [Actinoplanes sp. RD1]
MTVNESDRRARLLAAAGDRALAVLASDTIDVAAVAIGRLGKTEIPEEHLDALRAAAGAGDPMAELPAARELLAMIAPHLPEDEPDLDPDDRTIVLEFAAATIEDALHAPAGEAAWVLADLHAHLDDELGDFCMRRQNELLELLAAGTGPADPAIRASTALGRSRLQAALSALG